MRFLYFLGCMAITPLIAAWAFSFVAGVLSIPINLGFDVLEKMGEGFLMTTLGIMWGLCGAVVGGYLLASLYGFMVARNTMYWCRSATYPEAYIAIGALAVLGILFFGKLIHLIPAASAFAGLLVDGLYGVFGRGLMLVALLVFAIWWTVGAIRDTRTHPMAEALGRGTWQ